MTAGTSATAAGGGQVAQAGIGWALWSIAATLPWLLPGRFPPWPTFYSEWLMAAVMVPPACWVLYASRAPWTVDALVGGLALAACIPLLQAAGGLYAFPGEAMLASLYLAGFGLTVLLARHAEQAAPGRWIESLLAGLVLAAILSTGMALCQWLDVDLIGNWLAGAGPGGRPVANVGQPNNLATLLAWGLIAVWWGYARRRLGGPVAVSAAAFLLIGLALTQSRTGLVAVAGLAVAALMARRSQAGTPSPWVVLGLGLWFALLVLGLDSLSEQIRQSGTRGLQQQIAVGKRPMIWMLALEAIQQRPWFGHGWNQGVPAHVALADRFPDLQVTVQFAHNLVLDLALWNGVPLTLLMVAGLGLWFGHQIRRPLAQEQRLLLLALGVFLLHAMLELPHALAFFLLPVAVMMGTLAAWRPTAPLLRLPRLAVALLVLAHAGVLFVIFGEYRRIEIDAMAYRLRAARIGKVIEAPAPDVWALASFQSAMMQLRVEPKPGMSEQELAKWRKAVERYPSFGSLIRYARANALNDRTAEARWALETLCRIDSVAACRRAEEHWQALIAEGHPELARVEFPRHP